MSSKTTAAAKAPTPETLARIERDEAEQRAALWAAPLAADSEIPVMLRMATSSWQALKATTDKPKLFNIGRRVYARTADLRAWLDSKATAASP